MNKSRKKALLTSEACSDVSEPIKNTDCEPEVKPFIPQAKEASVYEHEVTSTHNGRMAPAGKVFVIVRVYSQKKRVIRGKLKRDRWQANILCDRKDIEDKEALKVITDHIYKQLNTKYHFEA